MAFLVDDILLFPVKAPIWVGKKISEMAAEEMLDEQGTRQKLRELYMLFEMGRISEEEFEEREVELVERLEEIEAYRNGNGLGNGL